MSMAAFSILTGFKFRPTDQELVGYLFRKLTGSLSAIDAMVVYDLDLYGEEEPNQLLKKNCPPHSIDDLYFFTKLKKKSKGSRIDRKVGDEGFWHSEDSGKKIVAQVPFNNQWACIQALNKRFKYKNKNSDQHYGWILHEISLLDFDTVLCQLRKNDTRKAPVELNNTEYEFNVAESLLKQRKVKFNNPVNSNSRNKSEENIGEPELNNVADSSTENREPELINLEFANGQEWECGWQLELNNTLSTDEDSDAWVNSLLLLA